MKNPHIYIYRTQPGPLLLQELNLQTGIYNIYPSPPKELTK